MKKPYNYVCHYCGDLGDHRDHVIPSSYGQSQRGFENTEIVIACGECNTLLGNKIFSSMYERGQYLADRLRARYRSTLNTPDWSPEELSELAPNMRAYVEASIRDRDAILRKLERLSDVPEIN